jgi:hypothetical protein
MTALTGVDWSKVINTVTLSLPAMVLIETTRAIFNNRRRVKLVLKDIEFIRCPYVLIF